MKYFSCYDNETGKFITAGKNSESIEECAEKAFEWATEGNDDMEVQDWIQAGGDKRGALEIMNFFIIPHFFVKD